MNPIARLILLLCLLPGLVTGLLPLPGQAAGVEMVICADGGAQTVHIGTDGAPVDHEDCAQCCIACGTLSGMLADAPEPALRTLPALHDVRLPALPDLPLARDFLIPGPRGPPASLV